MSERKTAPGYPLPRAVSEYASVELAADLLNLCRCLDANVWCALLRVSNNSGCKTIIRFCRSKHGHRRAHFK